MVPWEDHEGEDEQPETDSDRDVYVAGIGPVNFERHLKFCQLVREVRIENDRKMSPYFLVVGLILILVSYWLKH